jgi:uncharacterized protein (DUF1499 family)
MTTPHSRLGRLSTWLGRLAVLAALVGPTIAHFELVAPLVGFSVFAAGVLLAVLSLLTGVLALAIGPAGTRAISGRGMLPALAIVVVVLLVSGMGHAPPRINDISTDTLNPPLFLRAQTLPDNVGRDMSYPGEAFASQQREGYGEIAPVILALPPDETFKRVAAAARNMNGWVITREDSAARAVEGYDTSRLFRFKDDFVIEVRESNGQSVVQMRSKSRNGKGDVGANAQRIRLFLARVKE